MDSKQKIGAFVIFEPLNEYILPKVWNVEIEKSYSHYIDLFSRSQEVEKKKWNYRNKDESVCMF